MNWDNLFQIIVLLGSGGVLSILARAIVDRKKIRVDGVAVLSDTALKQAEVAIKQAERAQSEVEELREDMARLRQSLYAHGSWDLQAMRQLERAGIVMDPPPDIWII